MKISSIPQIYRHVNRWGEILAVLSKYELAHWIGRLGPDFTKDLLKSRGGTAIARHPWQTRVRLAMSELGPTFVKLGQMLSTRPDLIGVELAEELQQLQDNVPADSPDVIRATIEAELHRPLDEGAIKGVRTLCFVLRAQVGLSDGHADAWLIPNRVGRRSIPSIPRPRMVGHAEHIAGRRPTQRR